MPHVPGLRSCYAKVGRLIYFGRMLDKIRLHAQGLLPADYVPLLGDDQFYTLDGRCCRFLGLPYALVKARTLEGGSDETILDWAHEKGSLRTDEECHVWNRFIAKLGWRDERSAVLPQRIADSGLLGKTIETIIDHIEYDEDATLWQIAHGTLFEVADLRLRRPLDAAQLWGQLCRIDGIEW